MELLTSREANFEHLEEDQHRLVNVLTGGLEQLAIDVFLLVVEEVPVFEVLEVAHGEDFLLCEEGLEAVGLEVPWSIGHVGEKGVLGLLVLEADLVLKPFENEDEGDVVHSLAVQFSIDGVFSDVPLHMVVLVVSPFLHEGVVDRRLTEVCLRKALYFFGGTLMQVGEALVNEGAELLAAEDLFDEHTRGNYNGTEDLVVGYGLQNLRLNQALRQVVVHLIIESCS